MTPTHRSFLAGLITGVILMAVRRLAPLSVGLVRVSVEGLR